MPTPKLDAGLLKLVDDAVERYRREQDRYEKLATRVADICSTEIVERNAIRANVTYRAKRPKRFREKLEKLFQDDKERTAMPDVDAIFQRIGDLAGVRVLTYEEQDRERVIKLIRERFAGPGNEEVAVDLKDKIQTESGKFYRATHTDVLLNGDELVGTYENLAGVSCEIQVCSMLAHVWNEVEHDLVYKPTTGKLSETELDALRKLGHLTIAADLVIKHLYEATARRQKQTQGAFEDVHDFVVRIRENFPESTRFSENVGQLYDELRSLELNSPESLQRFFGDGFKSRAAGIISKFNEGLDKDWRKLDEETSDVLLALILENSADRIIANHPSGQGIGRPPRIAAIAGRFRKLQDTEKAASESHEEAS